MKLRKLFLTFLVFCLCSSSLFITAYAARKGLAAPEVKVSNSEYSGKVQLSWAAVDGAVQYKVYRADSADGKYQRATTTTSTSFVNSSTAAGKTYYYYVIAEDSKGTASPKSKVVSRTCDLPRPSITLSNVESTGKIRISWTEVDGATKYEVYRSTDQKSWSRISSTTKTAITNTGAVAGKNYYYKVRAISSKSAANSAYSNVKSRVCDLPRPAITGFSNSEYSGKIIVKWEAVSSAVSYKIYRADSKNGEYKLVGTTDTTSFTNSSTETGKTYYYKIRAIAKNTDANSAQSATASHICKLPRPTVKLSNVTSTGKVKISWDAVDGAVSYKVYRSTDGESWKRISTTSKTSVVNTGGSPGVTYSYKVRAIHSNADAASAYSAVKTRICKLAQPALKISNDRSTGYVKLSWDPVEGVSEYRVYRCTTKDGNYTRIAILDDTSFTDSTGLACVTYYYKVVAYCANTDGNSAYSKIVTGSCPYMTVCASLNEDGKPRLTWNGVEGAESYQIYRSMENLDNYKCIATTGYTSLTNSGAASGITYYYTVRALDANGKELYESDNQVSITAADPVDEELETNYVSGILLSLYHLPDSTASYTTVPYMTRVELGAPITNGDNGAWYRVFFEGELYYVWIEPEETRFTEDGSTFDYYSSNCYQQEVIDLASYIALNWDTVYEHNASKGEMKDDGTYGFDCSGFVRYVMNTVMQQYVPTYKIVAEIEDLVVTDSIYNAGYRGAFSAYEVSLDEIQPGDVIFFSQQSENDHCGIYLGNGEFVHSSNFWENSVGIAPLIDSYLDQISVIRRYLPEDATSADITLLVDPHNKDGTTTTQCKLYAERSTDSEQLRVLYRNDTVTLLFTDSDLWAYACLDDGTYGYILTRNLGSAVDE